MTTPRIETTRLALLLESIEDVRARIATLSDADRAELSADWLELVNGLTSASPWVVGFSIVRGEDHTAVGQCGFKGPPTADGIVEIAYAIEPDEQGKGYATEAAQALTQYALQFEEVRLVCAHTLPSANASTRVLTKCGFSHVGTVDDPDDGIVWRWELSGESLP